MPRFVILEHDHPALHWDFMLAADGVLVTWRLPAPPTDAPREAVAIGDHRPAYLDYEGPVSGGRGSVKRWDAGDYDVLERTSASWRVRLHGKRWQGIATLQRRDQDRWDMSFEAQTASRGRGPV